MKNAHTQPANRTTIDAAILTQARVVVTHTIANGQVRTRVGRIQEVREIGRWPTRTYVLIDDEVKGVRGVYLDSILNEIVFI